MDRTELGNRLLQWHSSISDPVYAVGSYYFEGLEYPDKEVVENCLANLTESIESYQKMLRGEIVSRYNSYYGRMVPDQRKFAGYTDEQLKENIADLEEIVSELRRMMQEDYQ